jgi:two-component system response regulator PrrA
MSKSIVILENDQEIKTILEGKLQEAGYEVHCPVDSYVAIEHVQHHGLDLIILNDQMPIINGKDTLSFLDEQNITVPAIVFLSKFQETNDYANRTSCVCIRKPFQIADLVTQVSQLLNK